MWVTWEFLEPQQAWETEGEEIEHFQGKLLALHDPDTEPDLFLFTVHPFRNQEAASPWCCSKTLSS